MDIVFLSLALALVLVTGAAAWGCARLAKSGGRA